MLKVGVVNELPTTTRTVVVGLESKCFFLILVPRPKPKYFITGERMHTPLDSEIVMHARVIETSIFFNMCILGVILET